MSEDKDFTNNEEEMDNVIELVDEDGNSVEFEHLLTFEYGDRFYVALLPVEPIPDMEDGEVLLMRVEESEDGEEETFSPVETEEELEGAWNAFMEIYYEDEDEDDDEDGCECGCGCHDCCGDCGDDKKEE